MIAVTLAALTFIALAAAEFKLEDVCKEGATPSDVHVPSMKGKAPIKVKFTCNAGKNKIESCALPQEGNKHPVSMPIHQGIDSVIAGQRLIFNDEDLPKQKGKVYALTCLADKEPTIVVLDLEFKLEDVCTEGAALRNIKVPSIKDKDPINVKFTCNTAKNKIKSCALPQEGNKHPVLTPIHQGIDSVIAGQRIIFNDEDLPKGKGMVYAMTCRADKEPTIAVLDFASKVCAKTKTEETKKLLDELPLCEKGIPMHFDCKDMEITHCNLPNDPYRNPRKFPAGKTFPYDIVGPILYVKCYAWEQPTCRH